MNSLIINIFNILGREKASLAATVASWVAQISEDGMDRILCMEMTA